MTPIIEVTKLYDEAVLPQRQHPTDAGADLLTPTNMDSVFIIPCGWAAIPLGIAIDIPHGYVGLVHPRSGIALRNGITVLNAPGTIDSGYRGEIQVILYNASAFRFEVASAMRIAQLVIQKVELPTFEQVSSFLGDTPRGSNGFGSTGL